MRDQPGYVTGVLVDTVMDLVGRHVPAVTEEVRMKDGWPVSTRMAALGILRSRDMPPVEVVGVEVPDPNGPFGAKGVGEIGLVPTAPAVANALAALDGTRHTVLPMRDPRLLRRRP